MPTSSLFSRRCVFAMLAAVTLAGLARAGIQYARPAPKLPEPLSSVLQMLEPSHNSAKAIGRVYLAERLEENDMHTLLRQLLSEMSSSEFDARDRAGLCAEIKRLFSKDFADGRTVLLDGWKVSLTEARLCALLTLAA